MTADSLIDLDGSIRRALDRQDLEAVASHLRGLSTGDVTTLMNRLDLSQRAMLFRTLPKLEALAVFDRLDPSLQADLITGLQDEDVAAAFAAMEPDDRAELLDELPANVTTRLLEGLSPTERELTNIVLGYPDGVIGRRMSPEFVTLRPTMSAAEAMQAVQRHLHDAETIYLLPVLGDERQLEGIVRLRTLMQAEPSVSISQITSPTDSATATEHEEVAARRCADQKLLAMPVVDQENRVVGLLTVDDALQILEEAESEDQARMSGSEPLRRPYLATPITEIVKARVVWLLVLAVGATLTVHVLENFEDTISKMVVLSVFVPLLIGTGGNTGNQAATTVTRALALSDVHPRDVLKVLAREARVGALLGLLLGTLGLVIASIFYGLGIGAVIGLTLLSICTLAATVGGAMPLLGKSLGIDPAVFANPFISTLVDASGLIIYFLMAKAVLGI
ncbi:magnesium transporter [Luteococcus sediminum]